MTGQFITIEGIEGAGKSTQVAFIKEQLESQGKQVVITREPGGTEISEKIRELLLAPMPTAMEIDTELLLMFAGRAEHVGKVIRPALERGDWVICDRFTDASFAYQGGGRGVPRERINILADWTLKGLKPNLTFLFDLTVELGLERVIARKKGIDRFEQEKVDFFERIRDSYLESAQLEPERIKIIDSSQSIDYTRAQLSVHLKALF